MNRLLWILTEIETEQLVRTQDTFCRNNKLGGERAFKNTIINEFRSIKII
jgi:hypothetical protein